MYYVNEYEVNKAYGGPEEGGWWYDTGKFIKEHGIFQSHDMAQVMKDSLQDVLNEKREGLAEPGSILCTGWPVIYIETEPGTDFPDSKPYYE